MELKNITKLNIAITTKLSIADLLEKKPIADTRLKKLKRQPVSGSEDLLVRGNPQLTLGYVTPIEIVEAYFEQKERKK